MSYGVDVDWAPAFELVISLLAYKNKSLHRTLELGASWVRERRADLAAADVELSGANQVEGKGLSHILKLLVWRCPVERDVDGFLHWLRETSVGDLYELIVPCARKSLLPRDLNVQRRNWVGLLDLWNETYFRHLDARILESLEAEAASRRSAVLEMNDSREFVELVTNGVDFAPAPAPQTIVLVPQYHHRPWSLFDHYHDVRLICYPVDAKPLEPGEPSPRLLRLSHALSDESRLRILRFLHGNTRSFGDIVNHMGLSKSTISHHLVALRAAGLVRVHDSGGSTASYSLRHSAVEDLERELTEYLTRR